MYKFLEREARHKLNKAGMKVIPAGVPKISSPRNEIKDYFVTQIHFVFKRSTFFQYCRYLLTQNVLFKRINTLLFATHENMTVFYSSGDRVNFLFFLLYIR